MAQDLLTSTILNNPYIPHVPTPKEALFLTVPYLEVMYGGAAGGGKSEALLMAALQYAQVPGYSALLLRRTYGDLALPGALMDRAAEWLSGTDAKWNSATKTWHFPSGASLTFGYLQTDKDRTRYQSAEFQFVGFDELTQFTEVQYRYLFSRLRRLEGANVPIRMRSATNPGGVGHEWVKQRFITGKHPDRQFIPARLIDNPHLDREQYEESLGFLDAVTRKQLFDGDWDVQAEGLLAKRDWFRIVPVAPAGGRRVRFWDFAATASKDARDPDYTVGTLMGMEDGVYTVLHVLRGRWGPGQVEKIVQQTAEADGRKVPIVMEQEPGAAGRLFTANMIKTLAGWAVRAVPSSGDKVTRAMPFLAQAQAGNVQLVSGAWVMEWLDEVCTMPESAHDDQWDSASGAFEALVRAAGGWSRGPA